MIWLDWLFVIFGLLFIGASVFCYIFTIVTLFRKKDQNVG